MTPYFFNTTTQLAAFHFFLLFLYMKCYMATFLICAEMNVWQTHRAVWCLCPPAEAIISQWISYCTKQAQYWGFFSETVGWPWSEIKSKCLCLMHPSLLNCQWEQTQLVYWIQWLWFLHCIYRPVKVLHLLTLYNYILLKEDRVVSSDFLPPLPPPHLVSLMSKWICSTDVL